jgi:hypothetical protein
MAKTGFHPSGAVEYVIKREAKIALERKVGLSSGWLINVSECLDILD